MFMLKFGGKQDRIKVTNDYLQIAQTKVQYSVRKVTEKMDFL